MALYQSSLQNHGKIFSQEEFAQIHHRGSLLLPLNLASYRLPPPSPIGRLGLAGKSGLADRRGFF